MTPKECLENSLVKVCSVKTITRLKSMNIEVISKGASKSLILIENKKNIYTYVNSCPHIGTPLDLKPGTFLSPNKKHIICSTHGALFTIDTGKCIFGPCKGESLKAVPNIIKNDCIYVNNS